jgi:hypothetical protein
MAMRTFRNKVAWLRSAPNPAADAASTPSVAAAASAADDAGDVPATEALARDRRVSETAATEGTEGDDEDGYDARMLEPERLQTLTQLIRQFSGEVVVCAVSACFSRRERVVLKRIATHPTQELMNNLLSTMTSEESGLKSSIIRSLDSFPSCRSGAGLYSSRS